MPLLYLGFIALVLALLALDLGVLHRGARAVGVREALGWSAVWIGVALLFGGVIYLGYEHHWLGLGTGPDASSVAERAADGSLVYNDGASALAKYLAGVAVEKSLAIDNLFVIAMICTAVGVPAAYQHRLLFWGIAGALVMRGAMIAVGAVLLARFGWIAYVFGAFLAVTGVKMLAARHTTPARPGGRVARVLGRVMPVTERLHGARFFVRAARADDAAAGAASAGGGGSGALDRVVAAARPGALLATPLLVALVLVELTDAVFAIDSIPAVFAITSDPFLVLTSNVFAILGMRSLYFVLAGMMERFRLLKVSLAIVLVVIGGKMMAHPWLEAWVGPDLDHYALGLIGAILAVGLAASLWTTRAAAADARAVTAPRAA